MRPSVVRRLPAPFNEPLFTTLFVLLFAVTLVPLWSARFLPLLDLPNHLDAIGIWHRFSDPSWHYADFYRLNLKPVPYWGYFFPVHLLAFLLPLEVANKLYLSAYALALPLGAALLARRCGRSPLVAVLVFPLVFNMNFMFGFITCSAGMAALLFALWTLDRFLDAPSASRGVALLLFACFLYFMHILPWLFFGVCALLWIFLYGIKRRSLVAAVLMLPSVVIAVVGFATSQDGSTPVTAGGIHYAARVEPLANQLRNFYGRLITDWQTDHMVQILLGILTVCWLLLLISGFRRRAESDIGAGAYRYRLEGAFGLALVASFALPIYLHQPVDLWMVGGRFVCVAAMFGALLPRGAIGGRRLWLLAPALAAALFYPLALAMHWHRFSAHAEGMARLMVTVPRGSSTLTLTMVDDDLDADHNAVPYTQFHSYVQFFGGGYNPWSLQTGFPMVWRKDKKLPSPGWKNPHSFNLDVHGQYYDYLITLSEPKDHSLMRPDQIGRAPLVGHDGDWRLYRLPHAVR